MSLRRLLPHYLMIAPFMILFAVFFLYPILSGLYYSFHAWNGVAKPEYLGFANYQKIVLSRDFATAMRNLLTYVAITVPLGVLVALGLALLVDSFVGRWANFFRNAFFMPVVLPAFLAATIWRWIYAPNFGLLNMIVGWFGGQSVNFLNDTSTMLYALIAVDVWVSAGFNMVIILAGLKEIPAELYEAARLDGANKRQQIVHITIPMLRPVLFFVVTYGLISAMQVFDKPWLLTGSSFTSYGGRRNALLFPVMDMMGRAFGGVRFGEAAAYGFLLTLAIVLVTAAMFGLRRLKGWA
ncbi:MULTISPECIES: carbohydrate ABC transporter permease [unclassified Mesorhizobium]|uniref:carbohydrate ABC transporter permease n=1 Tax=unclassified Mesorhizobium TaxID=325217 RepID=UPI001CCB1880|nr:MULTISPECIES: sugar ABC transporter permease [unclassified Mesorhizobium]MBZ9735754.1 sugar ABC transporter permease [Mesorhizobium sp. CA9]MBZ9817351.1 sugar ABC transporter permease [Mesorhizobium sp. CA7]MBZ9827645.1 sugar ABC transporter permease [Mesorhizobium sp. CA18]MBZ9833347.1 sugar ABC transporter permease [Mesorhizobium sp. CA2]MBZ9839642.1 sugar ABC transporter permease [Mesorhizobium sp. CA3]